jgi:excisionase family DNA binding protein
MLNKSALLSFRADKDDFINFKICKMVYLGVKELSEYLKKSESSIYKLTMGNKIPFIKQGKKLLFNQDAIDSWLEQYVQPTIQELQSNSAKILKTSK